MDRPGRKPLRTAGVTAAALLALLVAGRLTRSGLEPGEPGPPATGPPATTTNPARNPVLAAVEVGPGPPGRLAFGAGAVWAVADAGTVVRIDPARNRVAAAVRVAAPGGPRAVVAGAGAVWVAVASPGTLVRVDPASDRVTASVRLGRPLHDPVGLAATGGAVWVTCCGREVSGRRTGKLLRVDARTLRVTPVELPREPLGLAAGARQLWVSATDGSAVLVDPGTSRVAGVHAGVPSSGPAQDVAVGAGGVWLAYPGGSLVARLDPEHPDVAARVPVDAATLVAVGGGAVWVVATNDQGVVAIDPTGNLAEGGFPLAAVRDVRALVFGAGSLWVAQGSSRVLRVDPTKLQP
jgi:DNA-binding beta-propeller fold protein YncE